MKVFVITLCIWISIAAQSESLEKRAMSVAQQIPASNLDATLPNRAFAAWLNETIGDEAGVVWQLAECGAPITVPGGMGQDLPACAEAIALLPNGSRVIVAISVGTFKKGVTGEPAFLSAVIDSGEQLYQIRRLRDLPQMLRNPRNPPRTLPDIRAGLPQIKLQPQTASSSTPTIGLRSVPGPSIQDGPPPPAPSPQKPRKIVEGLLEGSVITRRMPVYPASARSMNAFGKVEVRIVISEAGRVIEATAISGHPALRSAAVDAARQWIYKPTVLNGVPMKVESVLSFTFTADGQ